MRDIRALISRPIAHRGLHDAARGVIENTPTAFAAALSGGYGIELDVQMSADGVPVVFHDSTLERLTHAGGAVRAVSASALRQIRLRGTDDRILPLTEILDQIAGQAPVFIEMKSHFDGDLSLALACARLAAERSEPLALMSFDPDLISAVRRAAPDVPRGLVAQAWYGGGGKRLGAAKRFAMGQVLHWPRTRFHFAAYRVHDLGTPAPRLARAAGIPVLTWTVRTAQDRIRAHRLADQMIFEGFTP